MRFPEAGGSNKKHRQALLRNIGFEEFEVTVLQLERRFIVSEIESIDGLDLSEFCLLNPVVNATFHAPGSLCLSEFRQDFQDGFPVFETRKVPVLNGPGLR